jgi:hypothetical protein
VIVVVVVEAAEVDTSAVALGRAIAPPPDGKPLVVAALPTTPSVAVVVAVCAEAVDIPRATANRPRSAARIMRLRSLGRPPSTTIV